MERNRNRESSSTIHSWFLVESTPEGEAPSLVREQWVGVALPIREAAPISTDRAVGVVTGRNMLVRHAIPVKTDEAIVALKAAGKEGAAAWWEENGYRHGVPVLLFNVSEWQLLSPDEVDSSLVDPFYELLVHGENPSA